MKRLLVSFAAAAGLAVGVSGTAYAGEVNGNGEDIPAAALDFYDDLEVDNTKSFWEAHKHVYTESVLAPMEAPLPWKCLCAPRW